MASRHVIMRFTLPAMTVIFAILPSRKPQPVHGCAYPDIGLHGTWTAAGLPALLAAPSALRGGHMDTVGSRARPSYPLRRIAIPWPGIDSAPGPALQGLAALVIYLGTGSVALLADLIHNIGDAATALPLAVAFLLRSVRAEKRAGGAELQ